MKKHCSAFTLLETLIVMAIIAVTTLSVPPLWNWLQFQGIGHAVDQLSADLHLARITAVRRKTQCALQFNAPGPNQYTNSLDGRTADLAVYHGGIRFITKGPDGRAMAARVTFNPQGMSTTAIPMDLFITDHGERNIYRVRVMCPGGITTDRWINGRWH